MVWKLYENFHIFHFQKRIVSAKTIWGNTVFSIDALVVWCQTWSKNLGRSLSYRLTKKGLSKNYLTCTMTQQKENKAEKPLCLVGCAKYEKRLHMRRFYAINRKYFVSKIVWLKKEKNVIILEIYLERGLKADYLQN